MGLPDFHSVRGSYTEIETVSDIRFITLLTETTIMDYTGYGEIIFSDFGFYESTAMLHRNDIIRLYLDGTVVMLHVLSRYIREDFDPAISLIVPRFYRQLGEFVIGIKTGLLFNKSIRLTYEKQNVGIMGCLIDWSIGKY